MELCCDDLVLMTSIQRRKQGFVYTPQRIMLNMDTKVMDTSLYVSSV